MKRVNVIMGRRGRVCRAFTCAPNELGEDRLTYCAEGASHDDDTTGEVSCRRCLKRMPSFELWPLEGDQLPEQLTPQGGQQIWTPT